MFDRGLGEPSRIRVVAFERLLIVSQRSFRFTSAGQENSEIEVGGGDIGIDREGFLVGFDRVVQLAEAR